MKQKLLLRHL